jgi:hypothetical protein
MLNDQSSIPHDPSFIMRRTCLHIDDLQMARATAASPQAAN